MTCNMCIHYLINIFWMDDPEKFTKYYCQYNFKNEKENCRFFSLRTLYEKDEIK